MNVGYIIHSNSNSLNFKIAHLTRPKFDAKSVAIEPLVPFPQRNTTLLPSDGGLSVPYFALKSSLDDFRAFSDKKQKLRFIQYIDRHSFLMC